MELGRLPYRKGKTFEDFVGAAGLKRHRTKKWRWRVDDVVKRLIAASAASINPIPSRTIRFGRTVTTSCSLCLPEIKSGHIRDAIRRGLVGKEYPLPSLRCAIAAHPYPKPSASVSHCSRRRMISESGTDAPRPRQ